MNQSSSLVSPIPDKGGAEHRSIYSFRCTKFNRGAAHRYSSIWVFSKALLNLLKSIMANTFCQTYLQIVFSPKNRDALIKNSWSVELEKYITSIVQNNGHKLLAIKAMPDHVHLFIGYQINQLIPTLVGQIKTSTNHWIQRKRFTKARFEWQKGYGVFSYSHSQLDHVIQYIANQEDHHKKVSFQTEYKSFLKHFNIHYKDEFLFEFFE